MEEFLLEHSMLILILLIVLFVVGFLYLRKRHPKRPMPADASEQTAAVEEPEPEPEPLLIRCPACGTEISRLAPSCLKCGHPIRTTIVNSSESHRAERTIIIQPPRQTNGTGTAGFVLSIISLCLSWLPGIGWVVWFFGLLLSFIGMFRSPRGLAIAGFIISLIDLIILIMVIGAIAGAASLLF